MNTINPNKKITHFKLSKNMSIYTCCFGKMTTSVKKIECQDCRELEKHFRPNYKLTLCYSRNDLTKMGVLTV